MEVIIFILAVGILCGFIKLYYNNYESTPCNRSCNVKIHASVRDPSMTVIWSGSKEISFEYKKVCEDAEGRNILLSEIYYDKDGRIFLFGMCHMRNEERSFLADRITSDIIDSTSSHQFTKYRFIKELCKHVTNIEVTEAKATAWQQENDDISFRKVNIKKLGDSSCDDKKFTLTVLMQLYDSDVAIQETARTEGGTYLAKILKNALTNSFGTDNRDTYKESLLVLESTHKIARLLRSENFRGLTSYALDMIPGFMSKGRNADNAIFFRELVVFWSARKRKAVKISVLKRFLHESGG